MPARALAAALVASAFAAPAHAHVGHTVARAERYIKLDVSGYEARVVVSLSLGAGEGRRALEAADADENGEVSAPESEAYLATWAEGLAGEVPVFVDGERVPLVWAEPYMEPIGAVRAAPVTVELVARFVLDGGRQTVRIEDRMVRREVYDRTDVRFSARDEARLIASGVGAEVNEPTPELAYGPRGGEPVVLTAVLQTPERPPAMPLWAIGAAVVVVIAAGGALAYRARRVRAGTGS